MSACSPFGLLALSLSAQSRKTVYVDKREGLELVEVDTGKVLASYSFAIKADAKARERIAAAFTRQVKKKLKP